VEPALSPVRGLVLPSFAKVNLGLEVLGVRQDGYHELRTLFQTIDLHDEIRLRPAPAGVTVTCDRPDVPAGEANLAHRAAQAVLRLARPSGGVAIAIAKRIPVGGGLGGGSSNAATVLRGLDRLWGLGLDGPTLHRLAARLGADVPFFLVGGTALGIARGDEVYALARQVRGQVVLAFPGRAVSTQAVFARLDRRLTHRENSSSIIRFISSDLEGGRAFTLLANDLEEAALDEAPELREAWGRARALLRKEGALLALPSGSGSTFFGLFQDGRGARRAEAALAGMGIPARRARTLGAAAFRARSAPGRGRAKGRSSQGA
jgi:4-diphosphocytidyl-2-C-methyl-D-erythritol kinase